MPPCGLDVAAVTEGQPFCAGVVLMIDGRLVFTLDREHAPTADLIRVGGVGGGQEPGESIVGCALREAREELAVEVDLISSPRTYIDDQGGDLRLTRCTDEIRPLVFWSRSRPDPTPYAPGLPAGPTLYGAMYLARLRGEPRPGDVDALFYLAPSNWALIDRQAQIGEAIKHGCELIERTPLQRDLRLWTDDEETMRAVCELATSDPELFAPLR